MTSTPTVNPLQPLYDAVDAADNTQNVQRALLALEALVEPTMAESQADRCLTVNREDLYCLLGVINTRLIADLEAARAAARKAAKIA